MYPLASTVILTGTSLDFHCGIIPLTVHWPPALTALRYPWWHLQGFTLWRTAAIRALQYSTPVLGYTAAEFFSFHYLSLRWTGFRAAVDIAPSVNLSRSHAIPETRVADQADCRSFKFVGPIGPPTSCAVIAAFVLVVVLVDRLQTHGLFTLTGISSIAGISSGISSGNSCVRLSSLQCFRSIVKLYPGIGVFHSLFLTRFSLLTVHWIWTIVDSVSFVLFSFVAFDYYGGTDPGFRQSIYLGTATWSWK